MSRFQTFIAYFLLLLFCRVLTPEQAILALHDHQHTEDCATPGVTTVSKAHQHCHDHDFFSESFGLKGSPGAPLVPAYNSRFSPATSFVWKFTFPNNTLLRGPPQA